MSGPSNNTHVWLAAGHTDMRKGFTGLSALVQNVLACNPLCGQIFVFRGRRGDLLKLLWWAGTFLRRDRLRFTHEMRWEVAARFGDARCER